MHEVQVFWRWDDKSWTDIWGGTCLKGWRHRQPRFSCNLSGFYHHIIGRVVFWSNILIQLCPIKSWHKTPTREQAEHSGVVSKGKFIYFSNQDCISLFPLISGRPCEFPAESQSAREYLIPMPIELAHHTHRHTHTGMYTQIYVYIYVHIYKSQ